MSDVVFNLTSDVREFQKGLAAIRADVEKAAGRMEGRWSKIMGNPQALVKAALGFTSVYAAAGKVVAFLGDASDDAARRISSYNDKLVQNARGWGKVKEAAGDFIAWLSTQKTIREMMMPEEAIGKSPQQARADDARLKPIDAMMTSLGNQRERSFMGGGLGGSLLGIGQNAQEQMKGIDATKDAVLASIDKEVAEQRLTSQEAFDQKQRVSKRSGGAAGLVRESATDQMLDALRQADEQEVERLRRQWDDDDKGKEQTNKEAEAARKEAELATRKRADADAQFDLDLEAESIQLRRMAGKEREAQLDEIRLRYAERILRVENDNDLSSEQKARMKSRLRIGMDAMVLGQRGAFAAEDRAHASSGFTRSLDAGLADANAGRVVFAGGGGSPAAQHLAVATQMAMTLMGMKGVLDSIQKSGVPVLAKYGS